MQAQIYNGQRYLLFNFYSIIWSDNTDWLCWCLTTRQPLWVILCHLKEKGRKEIVEEMKVRDSIQRFEKEFLETFG